MSHQNLERPTTFLPPDNGPSFGRPGRMEPGFTMPTGSGFISRIIMGGVRIVFMGALFKLIVPLGTMAVLFFFWPQILGMVTGGDGGSGMGLDGMTIVKWSLSMLKSSLIGMVGG